MRVPSTIFALFGLSANAWATCPASVLIEDYLTCSSSVDGRVNGVETSDLGGTGLNAYTCGVPYAPLTQAAGEDVYAFECQTNGDVTLQVRDMDCDLDIYVLDDTCDPFGGCVDGSTAAATLLDEVTFTCIAGETYYIVVEAYGWTQASTYTGYCGTGEGNYTLEFDVSAGTGCPEDCDNGLDDDFDGDVDCADSDCDSEELCCDDDNDGYLSDTLACLGDDCDDSDADVYPGADEYCNEVDDDCDVRIDEEPLDGDFFYADVDSDGYGDADASRESCEAPANHVDNDDDCDDTNRFIYPGAEETCDDVDQDCDSVIDEDATDFREFYTDSDADGYGGDDIVEACEQPDDATVTPTDCDDSDAAVHPGADEYCNSADDDCDSAVDEDALDFATWYHDADSDGYGDSTDAEDACDAPADHVADDQDCHDANRLIYPGADELCNSTDDDCDSIVDEDPTDGVDFYADSDSDGYGDPDAAASACSAPADHVSDATDCDDAEAAIYPGADEYCNETDDDCDDTIDEDALDGAYWHADDDGDGFGDPDSTTQSCDVPDAHTDDDQDCDDTLDTINPDADEIAYDGIDQDCDGADLTDVDEDGYDAEVVGGDDCDDTDPDTWPGASETEGGTDQDCDELVDEGTDAFDDDGDGYTEYGGDCDDADGGSNPSAVEECDDQDDDCDGVIDETTDCYDDDGDGYTDDDGDCNDADAAVSPGAEEIMENGIDDDCNGQVDNGAFDGDEDGYIGESGDCDEENSATHPGADELADGEDNDCDDIIDEGTPAYDDDGDGVSEDDGDCDDGDDAVAPGAPEEANGVDDDCDGAVDEGGPTTDDDGDGFSEEGGDCDDADDQSYPGAPETADGEDDDCDDEVDEGTDDMDSDGWSVLQGDCDDGDGWANPDREEVCDGVDNDCDGATDEGDCADLEGAGLEEGGKGTCGCASSGGSEAPGGAFVLLAALVAIRRRR